MKKPEKICSHEKSSYRKWLKRLAVRMRRRAEKANPETEVTKNRYYGWSI